MSRQDEVGFLAENCPHPTMAHTSLLIFLLCCECQVYFGKFCHEVLRCTESTRYQLPDYLPTGTRNLSHVAHVTVAYW